MGMEHTQGLFVGACRYVRLLFNLFEA